MHHARKPRTRPWELPASATSLSPEIGLAAYGEPTLVHLPSQPQNFHPDHAVLVGRPDNPIRCEKPPDHPPHPRFGLGTSQRQLLQTTPG